MLSLEQRNALGSAVTAGGLDGKEFSLSRRPGDPAEDTDEGYTICHIPSGSRFHIFRYLNSGGLNALAQYGDDPWMLNFGGNFDGIVDKARSWALGIPGWMATPNFWKSIPGYSGAIDKQVSEPENAPFTPEEQKAISGQLDAIAESVKKAYELTAEQGKKLDEKFEELKKDSKRLGRKDFKNAVIATFLALVITGTITPEIFQHALIILEHAIGHLFGGPPTGGILSAGQD